MKHPDLNELRKQFDKVVLRHFTKPDNSEFGAFQEGKTWFGTRAALVKGDIVYVGLARCDMRDKFNRRLGRSIALGRAIRAMSRTNSLTARKGEIRREAEGVYLSYEIKTSTKYPLERALTEEVFLGRKKEVQAKKA